MMYQKEGKAETRNADEGQQSHSACLLRAAKDTYDVHTNDLPIGFLDLFELPGREQITLMRSGRNGDTHLRKYQKRDLATTSLDAKMRMR